MSGPLRVGVVGVGAMGAAHARQLATTVPGTRVAALHDLDADRVAVVAAETGATVVGDAAGLVASPDVDAVVVTSPDHTHADLVHACLAAGKPVLCEKPLAVDPDEARRLVDAEVALGRRLVQVGFMRRYDPGFALLRRAVAGGDLGRVRVVHAIHRNASSTTSVDDAALVRGSMVHELDTLPWLLDRPLRGVRVESPVAEGFRDPQLATLWFDDGVMATVEVFVNAGYGYDVRCEVVGAEGTVSLAPAAPLVTHLRGTVGSVVQADFVAHFAEAYRLELAAWAGAAAAGGATGPSTWDGYAAAVAAEAGVASLRTGERVEVEPGERPALYATD